MLLYAVFNLVFEEPQHGLLSGLLILHGPEYTSSVDGIEADVDESGVILAVDEDMLMLRRLSKC